MTPLLQSARVKPVVLLVPSPLSWNTGTRSRMMPCNPRGNSNLLHQTGTHKSIGPDGIHTRILRELAEVLTKPLAVI